MGITVKLQTEIKNLCRQALGSSGLSKAACKVLKSSLVQPIDYMRYAEFNAILNHLEVVPDTKILDISSPQWFSLYLAKQNPKTNFVYTNVIDNELSPFKEICRALDIQNLSYFKEDVRNLTFDTNTFDQVISISVIEHIYPASGGDILALNEISRVLKPDGKLHLTVPYKEEKSIVYIDGPVYERKQGNHNFFAREYDSSSFFSLVEESHLFPQHISFIVEKPGTFALDYYEWGPGKSHFLFGKIPIALKFARKAFHLSLDHLLAQQYLQIASEPKNRLVNIAAVLKPTVLA